MCSRDFADESVHLSRRRRRTTSYRSCVRTYREGDRGATEHESANAWRSARRKSNLRQTRYTLTRRVATSRSMVFRETPRYSAASRRLMRYGSAPVIADALAMAVVIGFEGAADLGSAPSGGQPSSKVIIELIDKKSKAGRSRSGWFSMLTLVECTGRWRAHPPLCTETTRSGAPIYYYGAPASSFWPSTPEGETSGWQPAGSMRRWDG